MSWLNDLGYLLLHGITFLAKVFFFIVFPLTVWRYLFSWCWPWLKGDGGWRRFLESATEEELRKKLDQVEGSSDDQEDIQRALFKRRRGRDRDWRKFLENASEEELRDKLIQVEPWSTADLDIGKELLRRRQARKK